MRVYAVFLIGSENVYTTWRLASETSELFSGVSPTINGLTLSTGVIIIRSAFTCDRSESFVTLAGSVNPASVPSSDPSLLRALIVIVRPFATAENWYPPDADDVV